MLTPGRWAIWDDEGEGEGEGPPDSALGAKGEFTVTGEARDAELPEGGQPRAAKGMVEELTVE